MGSSFANMNLIAEQTSAHHRLTHLALGRVLDLTEWQADLGRTQPQEACRQSAKACRASVEVALHRD